MRLGRGSVEDKEFTGSEYLIPSILFLETFDIALLSASACIYLSEEGISWIESVRKRSLLIIAPLLKDRKLNKKYKKAIIFD